MINLLLLSTLLNDSLPIAAASFLDFASTKYALSQPGVYESNPILRSGLTWKKSTLTLGAIIIQREIAKRNPKKGKIFKYAAVITLSGLAVNNVIQTRKAKR